MRTVKTLVVGIGMLFLLTACETVRHERLAASKSADRPAGEPVDMKASSAASDAIITSEGGRATQFDMAEKSSATGGGGGGSAARPIADPKSGSTTPVSLNQAERSVAQDDRKIIRNAELTLQSKEPENAQHSLQQIAESLGGFVVSSELSHSPQADGTTDTSVNVVLRVPSARFAQALEAINKLDGRILAEKVSGQDVTEEFIDLDARLKSKKALESQFLEIMKQARKVEDALEVERELSDVRSEIEQLEGKKRFLENQSSLSTITVHLQSTAPVITATKSGLLQSFSLAFGDCIDTGAAIINGFIRFLGVLIPVTILILLPIIFGFRLLLKRFKFLPRKPEPVPSITGQS